MNSTGIKSRRQIREEAASTAQLARGPPKLNGSNWAPNIEELPRDPHDDLLALGAVGEMALEHAQLLGRADELVNVEDEPVNVEDEPARPVSAVVAEVTRPLAAPARRRIASYAGKREALSPSEPLRRPAHVSLGAWKLLPKITEHGHSAYMHELPVYDELLKRHMHGGWYPRAQLRPLGWKLGEKTFLDVSRRDSEWVPAPEKEPPATEIFLPVGVKRQYEYLSKCIAHYTGKWYKKQEKHGGISKRYVLRPNAKIELDLWYHTAKAAEEALCAKLKAARQAAVAKKAEQKAEASRKAVEAQEKREAAEKRAIELRAQVPAKRQATMQAPQPTMPAPQEESCYSEV